MRAGRNDPCHCGSGKKYKKCCLSKDEELKQEAKTGSAFSERGFKKLVKEFGVEETLGAEGTEALHHIAQAMHESRANRKTRTVPQLETNESPILPAAAVDISPAYPKPAPVRMKGALLRRGKEITREWLQSVREAPGWRNGEPPQELLQKTYAPLLNGWERHLVESFYLAPADVHSWSSLLVSLLYDYLPTYEGKLASDIGKRGYILRQYLGNFYPRKFMDCDLESIYRALKGIATFYVYLYHLNLIDRDMAESVVGVCKDHEFFQKRLEGYFRSEGDEMRAWVRDWDYDATIIEG